MYIRIEDIIKERASSRADLIKKFMDELQVNNYIIAGSSLNKTYNDIDIFPVKGNDWSCFKETNKAIIIGKTPNAVTLRYEGIKIQLCNYSKNTLEELVKSFDYTHVQVGAEIKNDLISKVFFTEDYIISQFENNSIYKKSEYPLSSLVRLFKYNKRGDLTKGRCINSIIRCLRDIYERGFDDYDDFKDQLDAVDWGLVPDDFKDLEFKELKELFEILKKE